MLKPRLVLYHQTHYRFGNFISILPLLEHRTGVTHIIIGAIHLNPKPGDITLNDHAYFDPYNDPIYEEVRELQANGVKVLGMLGGAHAGSYWPLDRDLDTFNAYYEPLKRVLKATKLDGIDLDIEEYMTDGGIRRLIDRLRTDFGPDFLITLAPIATALSDGPNFSGFNYTELERDRGKEIAWYNAQFYCAWGSMHDRAEYDRAMAAGWNPWKIVVGTLTAPGECIGWVPPGHLKGVLQDIIHDHPNFGGVMGWEYWGSTLDIDSTKDSYWEWAGFINSIFLSIAAVPGGSKVARRLASAVAAARDLIYVRA